MDPFELMLQENSNYFEQDEIKRVDIEKLFKEEKLTKIGNGSNARVFKVEGKPWVIKEGRWDLDISFFQNLKVKFPAEVTESILNLFGLYFLPRVEEIIRQYRQYEEMMHHFGYFPDDSVYYHPDRAKIFHQQAILREKLSEFKTGIEEVYSMQFPSKLEEILRSEAVSYNFLPKEYLLYGKSISPENGGKETYFIVQEHIEGAHFHDVATKDLTSEQSDRLIVLGYLILLLSVTKEMVPDMRPRYVASEVTNWYSSTDNILVISGGAKLIDTRWMWNIKDNVVKRGILLPEMTIESVKHYLIEALQ